MTGQDFTLITESGAPRGPRTTLVFNPAVVNPELGIRRSAVKEAARMASDLIAADVTTLVFCQTRQSVELVLRYLRERLARAGASPERVRGYRGGYLPTVRREIETALRDGELMGGGHQRLGAGD